MPTAQATVVAASEVWLVEITHDELQRVIRANPRIMESLSDILAEREEKNAASRQQHQERLQAAASKQLYLARLKNFFGL